MREPDGAVQAYIAAAIAHGHATAEGRHQKANNANKKILAAVMELVGLGEVGHHSILGLLDHLEAPVRLWAASHALFIDEDRAIRVLADLATKSGLIGFSARTTLDQWKRGGKRSGGVGLKSVHEGRSQARGPMLASIHERPSDAHRRVLQRRRDRRSHETARSGAASD